MVGVIPEFPLLLRLRSMPMSHLKQRCALSLAVARAISVGFRSFNGHLHFALPALLASEGKYDRPSWVLNQTWGRVKIIIQCW